MAETSTKQNPSLSETMQFVGPAQKTYPSFMDLAMYSLGNYCQDWNNPLNPASYILPPVFDFKHPDKSDEDMEIQKKNVDQAKQEGNIVSTTQKDLNKMQRPVIDRQSDDGEFIVYQALWELVQGNIKAPVLAVHGLDLEKLKGYLQQIFPHVQSDVQVKFKEMMREYDFILIGPRIGIIVIEVKSSRFTKGKDLATTNKHLPDHIMDGINQLNSFNVEFFQECAGHMQRSIPVRKILFTPNLEKNRLCDWMDQLDQSMKQKVKKLLYGITHWLKEDMINIDCHSCKPALYGALNRLMKSSGFEIAFKIFESYGAITAGLRSVLVMKKHQQLEIFDERLSKCAAISKHAKAIDRQDLVRKLDSLNQNKPPSASSCHNGLDPNSVIKLSSDRIILLTPEQQSALNGSSCQFIVGFAGTGKTIILLAKALQLLSDDKSVLIYSTPGYWKQYKIATNENSKCHIVTWEDGLILNSWCQNLEIEDLEKNISEWNRPLDELVDYLSYLATSNIQRLPDTVRELISSYDAIFIDDACESRRSNDERKTRNLLCFMSLMAVAMTNCSPRIVWVALDHYVPGLDSHEKIYCQLLNQLIASKRKEFICTPLNRVMRCSQSVFDVAYSSEILQQTTIKPTMGHKIVGFSDVINVTGQTEHLQLLLWDRTNQELEKFKKLGFNHSQIAIIMASHDITYRRRRWCHSHILMFYQYHMDFTDTWHECQECYTTLNDISMRDYFLLRFPASTVDSDSSLESGILTVDTWDNVSSFEWPIVIVCGVIDQTSKDSNNYSLEYKRYRACSRATTALVEITAQSTGNPQAEAKEHLEVCNFHFRLRSALDEVTKPSPSKRNATDKQRKPLSASHQADNKVYGLRLGYTLTNLPEKWKELFEAVWIVMIPDSPVELHRSWQINGELIAGFLNGLHDEELRYYQLIIDKFYTVMTEYAWKG